MAEYQLQRMVETKDIKNEIMIISLRDLNKYTLSFDIDKVVYVLLRLNRLKELISLLCLRMLHIEQQEVEVKKAKQKAYSHLQEQEYFNQQRQDCMNPILNILECVHFTIMMKKHGSSTLEIINTFIYIKTDKSVYDFLKDEILRPKKLPELNELKLNLIKEILVHDNEKLHLSLLSWMTANNLYEDLKNISSKYYGRYIEGTEKKDGLNIYQIELV